MKIYQDNCAQFSADLKVANKKYNTISVLRMLCVALFLGCIYFYIQTLKVGFSVGFCAFFIGFVLCMRWHTKVSFQKKWFETLLQINTNEISFLKREGIPFENGIEFNDFGHPYAFDLDIFGENSLFQNLNRTATYSGKKTLAENLKKLLPITEIKNNQDAIQELNLKLKWRQAFLAFAKLSNDSKAVYDSLLLWTKFNSAEISKTSLFFSKLSPLLMVLLLVGYGINSDGIWLSLMSFLFVLNLGFSGLFLKRILAETAHSSNINAIIFQYSKIIETIEKENFGTIKLKTLQNDLGLTTIKASTHLKNLSELFSRMDSSANFLVALLFNGLFLFNLHVLKSIIQWKKNHGSDLKKWLDVIGEFEMLNSLANFSYNNPNFVFPSLNDQAEISFSKLSHPLLNPETRIGNEVDFASHSFIILTGSNMSGKSTFLRSLGVNMVLAGIGSPVCASKANIHPIPVLVSMRLSDSLSDSESYFFAEIKRLKLIMGAIENQTSFVLLDEILRGTNSDDKRNGTIQVIKKVIAKNAIGVIATHDIEVCLLADEFPNVLQNQCFEVQIQNDELYFDYTMRGGICQNKSATFLMKKMGVI